jgi:SAM-dependent methyltransferase
MMRPAWDEYQTGLPTYVHRKLWEWAFIAEALHERGVLRPGSRGLGFGVGKEPLVALFARLGCDIVATDVDPDSADAGGWITGGQYVGRLEGLNQHEICDPVVFESHAAYRTVDMNRVPADLTGFDFTWSACAFEHVGSIALGQEFILRQMRCLRPGGVAVHTTEFNLGSDDATVEAGETVFFRRRDIEWLASRLRWSGHRINIDLDPGDSPADRHIDTEPWSTTHLKLSVSGHVITSLGLIIEKAFENSPSLEHRMIELARPTRRWLALKHPGAVPHFDGAEAQLVRLGARLHQARTRYQ